MDSEKDLSLSKLSSEQSKSVNTQSYKAFIYDITLKILFDGECVKSFYDVNEASMATIIGQIIHKYKKWGVAGEIIMIDLIKQAEKLTPKRETTLTANKPFPPLKWETTIRAKGYYYGKEIIGELPIVYDCLSYIGFIEPEKSEVVPEPKHYSMVLSYTATFFLSPALQVAKPYYQANRFVNKNKLNSDIDFSKFCDAIIESDAYDNDKIWKAVLKEILILKNKPKLPKF